ncbi:MAG: hypothetical protein ACRDCB_00940 [Clostridium sp.]|nr:hypothetical protein [Clostridium sp. LY3-2]
MMGYKYQSSMSNAQIEEKARGLGMHYKDECKVFLGGEDKK